MKLDRRPVASLWIGAELHYLNQLCLKSHLLHGHPVTLYCTDDVQTAPEGVVIRTDNKQSHTSRITVRKIASGVGVEKSFLLHSPLLEKVEVVRRAKVRRNFLSYLRNRSGKSARLAAKNFDRLAVNDVTVAEPEVAAEETLEPAAEKTEA